MNDHLKSWDQHLYKAEFAYNRSVNRSTSFRPFVITYGYNPRTPHDLAPILGLKHVNVKVEDLITQIQEIHTATAKLLQETSAKHLQETSAKYKQTADKKRKVVEFEIGDFVWAILT